MKLPDKLEVLVITLSDRAHRGEYEDLSGPRIKEIVSEYFTSAGWDHNVDVTLIPDDNEILKKLLKSSSALCDIIITTGGDRKSVV